MAHHPPNSTNTRRPLDGEHRIAQEEGSPGLLIWQLSAVWERRLRAELERIGLTHVQFILLAGIRWLSREGSPVTQVELARRMKTDVMTTSQVLRTLEKRGLVERAPHPSDTRAKRVLLVPASRRLLNKAFELVEVADGTLFSTLGGRVTGFAQVLRKLLVTVE